jgi:anamorsin
MDIDLIEEESLIQSSDYSKLTSDCRPETNNPQETIKKKACKDCTCGLAEQEEKEKTEKSFLTVLPMSSCGNCYLGDAFRCASCPYKGTPASN